MILSTFFYYIFFSSSVLMLGIGIGLVFACGFISDNDFQYGMSDWALVGCVALCGGLGLVISFIIEHNLFKKEE